MKKEQMYKYDYSLQGAKDRIKNLQELLKHLKGSRKFGDSGLRNSLKIKIRKAKDDIKNETEFNYSQF